jgi:hypothetical protein
MSNRTNHRSKPKNDHLHESIAIYLKMQKAETEEEFHELLAEHDRCTDADGKPRLVHRTLEQFRRGSAIGPSVAVVEKGGAEATPPAHPPAP